MGVKLNFLNLIEYLTMGYQMAQVLWWPQLFTVNKVLKKKVRHK